MQRPFGLHFATRSVVAARHGMVATSQPLAVQVGLDILKRGGSAVDAAIAVNAAMGLMEPTGCGIGGDLFAIIHRGEEIYGLNGSGRSPAALTRRHFEQRQHASVPRYGPLSVSVPGTVDAWCTLHARFGRLSLTEILAPAIGYAREGFPVSEIIAGYWGGNAARFRDEPEFAHVFMPGGRAPKAGETFTNPALAAAYELIGRDGRDAFYEGSIAACIHRHMQRLDGFLRRDDLAAHRSEWVIPISTTYRDWTVWQLPPNAQGAAVLQMLNLLEGYDLASLGRHSPAYLHLLVEAKKLAFEDRARHYADPAFADVPLAELVSKEYAAARRRLIDAGRASSTPSPGNPDALSAGDTVYLTTADAHGLMVSLIQSNFRGMGSGVMVPDYGFMLQNRGELFALDPRHANAYKPGKRPFNTIIPGLATRGRDYVMSFGVMGADMQPQGQVQVLQNMIDFGMNIQEAGDAPRLRHDGSSEPTGERARGGGTVHLEAGFEEQTAAALRALGHQVTGDDGYGFGGYQAILHDVGRQVYLGASESRKDGHAAGY